jgi:uncharacterized protein YegJ (DUF2314 family)
MKAFIGVINNENEQVVNLKTHQIGLFQGDDSNHFLYKMILS